ncbi:hypothetical protein KAT08_03820 [Candidatus Babeliales bacterium]|nr:hypothetical protein [Candidatus Babeliales bacterium]
MFKLNDKVIYPGHGVAQIDEIVEKKVAGLNIKFFKLKFLYKDMTILLPIGNFENSGVRYPYNKKEIKNVLNELCKVPKKKSDYRDSTPSGWNKRNKEYQLKIQEGKLIEIARIYRDLMYVSREKELSFGEKNLMQVVEELLVQEIHLVTNHDREFIIQELQDPFKQFFFNQKEDGGQVSSSAA